MLPHPPVPPGQVMQRPHRGTTVLVLGIPSLVFQCAGWIFGVIAWSMGSADLREMDTGRMDPSGRGLTNAGRICGMISVIWHLLILGVYVVAALALASFAWFFGSSPTP